MKASPFIIQEDSYKKIDLVVWKSLRDIESLINSCVMKTVKLLFVIYLYSNELPYKCNAVWLFQSLSILPNFS